MAEEYQRGNERRKPMKTQIYATFGPSCGTEDILRKMIAAGMTGMRLNLSHTTLPASKSYIEAYQNAARELGVKPQILIDMQGPELRVGSLSQPVELEENQEIILTKAADTKAGTKKSEIPVPAEVIKALEMGDKVLLDDGKIQLEIQEAAENTASAKVLRGGLLKAHKSIKIQNKNIKMPVLTHHDRENIKLAKEYGVTGLMQPFVLSGEDLAYVRKVLKENNAEEIQIFAKIENRLGVENLEDILTEADWIVIARGDLGNDIPLWQLPAFQKRIEETCNKKGIPYVVVTQMLASMEENPVPTRAEVSDIFHGVYHGASGVMITGESAIGKYPIEAVTYLKNTAEAAEQSRDGLENFN